MGGKQCGLGTVADAGAAALLLLLLLLLLPPPLLLLLRLPFLLLPPLLLLLLLLLPRSLRDCPGNKSRSHNECKHGGAAVGQADC
jgi:hypothetical protein